LSSRNANYLDRYGEGYEQRAKRTKRIIAAILIVVVGGAGLYLGLRNHRQKAQVSQFVELLQKRDYSAAYRLWVVRKPSPARITRSKNSWKTGAAEQVRADCVLRYRQEQGCGSGVIVTVDMDQNREERFWVEDRDLTIDFRPGRSARRVSARLQPTSNIQDPTSVFGGVPHRTGRTPVLRLDLLPAWGDDISRSTPAGSRWRR